MPGAFGAWLLSLPRIVSSTLTTPITSSSISAVIAPGLKIIGGETVISRIVDSSPISTLPPSMIISIFPFRSSHTCSAVVGLGRPDVLALGADTYPPAARISFLAIRSLGILTATVSRPPVVPYGTRELFSKIIVKGPGQKCFARSSVSGGTFSVISLKSSRSAI